MEEFIDDIVGSDKVSKTETKMTDEIQKTEVVVNEKTDKTLESDDKLKLGAEGAPAVVQDENKSKEDDKTIVSESDPVKELASQLGWRKDHTGDDAVDASTYILRSKDIQKSMGQHNKDLKDQLQALGGSVDALKAHNENVYQAEVKKLTAEVKGLKKERRTAVELADVAKVDELDEQIEQKQKDLAEPKPTDKQGEPLVANPVYDDWVKDNGWYLEDDDMAKFADTVAQQYVGAPLERVYAIVRSKVQEIFPEKFKTAKVIDDEKQESVKHPVGPKSPVESSSAKVSGAEFTKADLSSAQLQIMKQFVSGGIMTEKQYVNDIAKMQ